MDILDSVRRSVRHYPGGLEAVAVRLGKSPSTLEKELRAAPQYKLGAVDAADIAAMCADAGTAHALEYPTRVAEAVGCTLLALSPQDQGADEVTAAAVAGLMRELAEVVTTVTTADRDDEISEREMRDIQAKWAALVSKGQVLLQMMEAKHARTMQKWEARDAARR